MALEDVKNTKEQENFYEEKLLGTEWFGEIVDSNDPLKIGRCRIRVYEKFDNLKDDELPWASPVYSCDFAGGESKGFGTFSYPKKGSIVRVSFNQGDIYHPEYYVVENINDKVKTTIEGSYENAQVIRLDEDEDLQIFYTKEKGLMIWHKESFVNIDKSKHITITHAGNPSKVEMSDGVIKITSDNKILNKSDYIYLDSPSVDVGTNADAGIVRWEDLKTYLTALNAIIDLKYPLSPAASQLMAGGLFDLCKSTTAKVAR